MDGRRLSSHHVSNLLVIKSIDHTHELVVRAALGASRWRIVRHQLAETGQLAIAAGIAGIIVAVVGDGDVSHELLAGLP